jgi:non-specific serine/threonine protein kinase
VGRLTRHRSVQAALDASYVLLPALERTVFERLSVFAGPFDSEAAAAVAFPDGAPPSRVLAVIAALVDASVLTAERDGEHTRYRLLETIREYGATRLRSRGTEDDARRVHADYHLSLVALAGSVVGRPEFACWVDRLGRSYGEVRQALGWSLVHEDRALTLRAAPALREFWYRHADPREAGRWTARMLEGDVDSAPADLLAEVHVAACFAAVMVADLPAAATHADTAVTLSRETGHRGGLITALWARSQVALSLGDLAATRRYANETLALCDRVEEPWWRARPLTTLAFVALFGGSPGEARALFEEALPLYRQLGDLGGLVLMTLTPLSDAALRLKDLRAAERYATEAVELALGSGWEAAALVLYGQVLTESGDLEAAEVVTVRGLQVALHAGLENWFRMAVRNLARTAVELDRCDDAAVLVGASRRNMPAYGLDPAVYGPIEQRCQDVLGHDLSDHLARRGGAMTHDQLMNLAWSTSRRH